MKLSVIIPSYNFSKYIEQCLYSVLFQNTNFDFEVLVRDDFSNDGTNEILERISIYYPNLKYYVANENWGFHKNIKFLMEEARGEYIAYLDGDDYFTDKDKLQRQIDFLDNNPDYVMHAMGYWRLYNDGTYVPSGPEWTMWALREDVTTEDLMENNYVGFGRVFRNIPNLFKDYFLDLPFFDYPLNYEISRFGKIKNIPYPGGIYRAHGSGLLTTYSDDDKKILHDKIHNFLLNKYKKDKMKKITIIDAFIHNENVESKLNSFVSKYRNSENEILLISNTVAKKETVEHVDYYFYNKNNQLFTHDFDNVLNITLFKYFDKIKINEVVSGLQRHGLSVIVNLFKSLKLAKSLGYTYFQRIETDDLHGHESIKFIDSVPDLCLKNNKKGLFFFNERDSNSDVSFHYFFCEIDYFLSIIKEVNSESDYVNFIRDNFNNNKFINVEEYLYTNIINNDNDGILKLDGSKMNEYFVDTHWNSETSQSNMSSKYEGASTRLYRADTKIDGVVNYNTGLAILSYNYTDIHKQRRIIVTYDNGDSNEYLHDLQYKGYFVYNVLNKNISHIEVYDGDRFMYREDNNNIESNILFE
jgi:glycosyltransferase involved in cell wall biosynthesis